jgi:PEGA domain
MVRGLFVVCVLALGCGGPPSSSTVAEPAATPPPRPVADPTPGVAPTPSEPPRAKPTIAILGLEVYDNGAGVDQETIRAAHELSAALRDRARAGTGPYLPAPGGDQELNEIKLRRDCQSEAPACMAAIGTDLGADLLMYGKIEKTTQPGASVYKVAVKLLRVARRQLAGSTVDVMPIADITGVGAARRAKVIYNKVVGAPVLGRLALRANVDRGVVFVDDEPKGTLGDGSVMIEGIAEGRHTLAIEARGYQRYETTVEVKPGEDPTTHHATLLPTR